MKIYNISFSPTGGTLRIADLLIGINRDEEEDISLMPHNASYSAYSFNEDDLCVISVPSFGGRVPEVAVERLSKMKGNGAKCILICAYGNRAYEDTLLELKNTVKEAGFFPFAAIAAVAQHSIMRQYAKGRPDEQDWADIRGFAEKIFARYKEGNLTEVEVPGNYPYKKYNGVPFIPKVNITCVVCDKCAHECPVGAIREDNPRKIDKSKCISCMRCVAICKRKARRLSRSMVGAAAKQMAPQFAERKRNELFMD